ncbi:MAG: penicillin-binding protein 2, partial [Alphaproteobacteria bacterium]|nr:penicillin-binding protein 2 [Alphaproteobacteria bacterium]
MPAEIRQIGLAVTHQRLMVLMLLFMMVTAVITGKLGYFAVHGLMHNPAHAASGFVPPRADIVDRNGEVLARDIDAWSIGIHPDALVNSPEELAPKLAQLMPERTVAQYLQILRSHEKFTYLRRRALPELVAQVNALGEPAIEYLREPERLYPQTTLAAHVLGYTDFNGNGVAGMERALNARLIDPAQRNTPVALSIDSRVQAILEAELSAGMMQQRALGAAGLVLDANTGEVLAMASLPVFNPNTSGQTSDDARRNNVTQSVYELGSTFKPLTFANAIDTGTVTNIAKRWDATAPLHVGQYTIHDDEPANRWLNMPEALVHSSNIVTAQIADQMGQQKTMSFFTRMHFNEPPRIELHEKGRPIWPKYWARTTVMTIGFGHGMAVTPLQLATGYAALANGGILRAPTLLKLNPGEVPPGERVISASTSLLMRKMLRLVVLQGTGERANVEGMRIGGKTGTAEVPGKHGYN